MIDGEESEAGKESVTVSHLLGEMTWLLSQSPIHRHLELADMEWLIMPPLIHKQFYTFRDAEKPVGLALWARCGEKAETKLQKGLRDPAGRLTLEEWNSGDAVWLVDLVAPFADADNKHGEIMLADLVSGPLSGVSFKFHQTDVTTGERVVQTISADAGERLRQSIELAIRQG